MPPEHCQHLHCPHCGYDLTGLTEYRCPECGRGFDENALRRAAAWAPVTFAQAVFRLLPISVTSGVAGVFGILPFSCLAMVWDGRALLMLWVLCTIVAFALMGLNRTHEMARQMTIARSAARGRDFDGRGVIPLTLALLTCMILLSAIAFVAVMIGLAGVCTLLVG